MKKIINLLTSAALALTSVTPVAVMPTVAVETAHAKTTIADIVKAINSNSRAEEEQVERTTQAPPLNGETRAFIKPVNSYQEINVGDDVNLSKFMLELSVWGFDDEYLNDMYRVEANELNYRFPLGMHDSCYTIDMSEVDTKTAGTYTIHVEPTAYAKDTFVLRDSTSKKFPNGEYEFEIQGGFLTDFDLTVYVNDPTTTATTLDPAVSTTQAPPQNGEVRAYIMPELSAMQFKLGEKFSVDDISLRMGVWGYDEHDNYFCDTGVNYVFTVGSGKHKNCYKIDASEVDTSKPGNYRIFFTPLPNVKETFVLDDSYSGDFPNGEYEFVSQGGSESVIDVHVYDPALVTTENPEYTTTTIAHGTYYTTQTTVALFTTTTVTTGTHAQPDYAPMIEYDNSIMQVGESRKIRFYNPETKTSKMANVVNADIGAENVSIEYNEGDDFITITALKPGNIELYIREATCSFNGVVKIYVDGDPTIEISRSDITRIEYDNTPMIVGESRKIRFYNPKTRKAGKATIEHSDNISVSYNEGDDFVIITALAEGNIMLNIHDETCEYAGGVYYFKVANSTLYGDANCDGVVNIADATAIIQAIGNPDRYALSELGAKNADCYNVGDGVTGLDAMAIQKLEAKLIKSLPVNE